MAFAKGAGLLVRFLNGLLVFNCLCGCDRAADGRCHLNGGHAYYAGDRRKVLDGAFNGHDRAVRINRRVIRCGGNAFKYDDGRYGDRAVNYFKRGFRFSVFYYSLRIADWCQRRLNFSG